MAGADPTDPKDLWSDFIPHIEETLNLLRRGCSCKSAWEDLFGTRDFNAVPIAPAGIKVVAHVPPNKRASWDVLAGKIVAYYKLKNGELVMRVHGTIGSDQLPYDGPTAAQTAALELMRLLLNALLSEGANLMTLDIKDFYLFYLGTPLDEPEHMRVPLKFIPLEMQAKYNLKAIQ